MRSEPHSETGYIDTIDFTFFEMVRQRGVASPVIRINTNPARTEHITIADLQKTSFELVGHFSFLPSKFHWQTPVKNR